MSASFHTLCLCVASFFPPEHRSHGISLPFLFPQHTVEIFVITVACQRLLGLVQCIFKSLLMHLALGQPRMKHGKHICTKLILIFCVVKISLLKRVKTVCTLTLSPTERIFHPLLLFLQLSSSVLLSPNPNPSFYHPYLGKPSGHYGIHLFRAGKWVNGKYLDMQIYRYETERVQWAL